MPLPEPISYAMGRASASGSGGGTTNYLELDNKPEINGVPLVGNQSGADLIPPASDNAPGLLSVPDKMKLDGIEAGAQVNAVTGVKGNAETEYQTGNINLTPDNLGAAPLESPHFSGTPTVPTAPQDRDSLQAANTTYVRTAIANKANTNDVEAALALKADTADMEIALSLKADAASLNPPVTVSGNPVSFTTEGAYPLNPLTVHIEPVQSGEGDPSPENIRPITGWDSLTVTRTGKNLADPANFVVGGLGGTGNVNSNEKNLITGYVPVFPGRTYTKWWSLEMPEPGMVDVALFDRDKNYLRRVFANTFTTPSDCYFVRCEFKKTDGTEVTASELTTIQVQVEESAAFTGYSPYAAQTVTVSTGEAGTVYGGTWDVARGVLTVTWAAIDLHDMDFRTLNNIVYFYKKPSSAGIVDSAHSMCSVLPYANGLRQRNGYYINQADSAVIITLADTNVDSAEKFNAWVDANNAQLIYELAEPVTYQLTPREITTLTETNTVSANCGPVDVAYRPGAASPVLTRADAGAVGGVPSWEQFAALLARVEALEKGGGA